MRNILCIDLKSFFASCECLDKFLDPFTTPLVVANEKQGNGAITLAITPYLKNQGIKSRSRLYEIPKHIKYIIAPPRMSLYAKKSSEVIGVYLDFIAKEDIHVYSIDEAFLDVTEYLKMYKMTDYQLAETILKTITKKTGLTATCGIGPNLVLAKIALDTDAKKYKNGITKWEQKDIKEKLWPITPLSKIWGIGPKTEKKLNQIGIYKVKDLALYDKNKLKQKFGVIGIQLWEHANGIDESRIKDMKTIPKEQSISHSQVLLTDYNINNARLIVEEMCDVLVARLRTSKQLGCLIGFGLSYSMNIGGGFNHHIKLDNPTDDLETFKNLALNLYDQYTKDLPIRKINLSIGRLSKKDSLQLNIFEPSKKVEEKEKLLKTVDDIKIKYGKNSILNATALLKDSTIKERNKKIGGHNS